MLKPMLASLGEAPLRDSSLAYEPKYDGIRAIVDVPAAGPVRLWSRLGNDKTAQFPEIAAALERWRTRQLEAPLVLDGEVVALDPAGEPTGFQKLQGRIHGSGPADAGRVAFIAFDILRQGSTDLRQRPFVERRAALERVFSSGRSPTLRLSEVSYGDGLSLYDRALESGWEGLIAKRKDSRYHSGKRTPDWCKLKIVSEQEFVVGGWTDPRQARTYFGALLLGVYEPRPGFAPPGALVYVGHTGTGFGEQELGRLMQKLRPLAVDRCPFESPPPTNERPHWVEPKLVVQVKFTEWTADSKLRHPVYLGLRDDKRPADVRRERETRWHASTTSRLNAADAPRGAPAAAKRRAPERTKAAAPPAPGNWDPSKLLDVLRALEDARKDGVLDLPGDRQLAITNLHKVFWPRPKLTKGDLLRYYVEVAPFVLPVLADRPLVMKRFPNGVDAKPFYQHRAPEVAAGVRAEPIAAAESRVHVIGGDLLTLLYTKQLAAISDDPWFSRVQSAESADYIALDLDPPPGLPFRQVLDVARWIRDELGTFGATGVVKTSGSEGLHVYVALPPGTSYDAGVIFAQIVATLVAERHPKQATVERAVRSRGNRVYVDFLQNGLGKTLAAAYSARATDNAGVSTPITWDEVDSGVDREDFTIRSVPARLREVGDVWARLRDGPAIDLARLTGGGRSGRPRSRH
jgi:bifunctional non-homologous end joining protein LigD